jgi:hypothetical protein
MRRAAHAARLRLKGQLDTMGSELQMKDEEIERLKHRCAFLEQQLVVAISSRIARD